MGPTADSVLEAEQRGIGALEELHDLPETRAEVSHASHAWIHHTLPL